MKPPSESGTEIVLIEARVAREGVASFESSLELARSRPKLCAWLLPATIVFAVGRNLPCLVGASHLRPAVPAVGDPLFAGDPDAGFRYRIARAGRKL
jgi:hypothetical protein